jgi:predicted ABC-type transport system involved in lysophospholipase L1 biosynthesis ATPase subunit
LLRELHTRHGLTSVIVTHNPDCAARCDRALVLHDGKVSGHTMENRSYV